VVFNWLSKLARSAPDSLAICSRAALPSGVWAVVRAMVSYQMPVRALPRFGLAFRASVLTIRPSRISPGIFELSKTSVAPGIFFTSDSCGFQVTRALVSAAPKAATMSASEVLTVLTSLIFRPAFSRARASR
jgi:hypothetical protein